MNNSFAGVALHAGQKSDVPIRHEQFFRSLVNNLRNRLLTIQSSNVSTKGNDVSAASYDEMVTWTKVLSPENWPEFPSITEGIKRCSMFGETEIQMMSERLNVDGRQSIRAFRQFKDTRGKTIPSDFKPLLLALNAIPVCTANVREDFLR